MATHDAPRIGRDTRTRWLVRDVPADAATLTDVLNAMAKLGWDWVESEWIVYPDPPTNDGVLRLTFTGRQRDRKPFR